MKVFGEVKRRDVLDIECDRCHTLCRNQHGNFQYAELNARWSFGSKKDTQHHQLHLCEPCYDWLHGLLKENGVAIRVAEGDMFTGESIFD
jgi:hypothetical protein